MSLTQRVKQGFLRLPLMKKAILIASLALAISPLLPWYDHRNNFGVGDTFLGIQGPLFMIGFLVLAAGLLSFFNVLIPLTRRGFLQWKRRTGSLALIMAVQSLLLLLLANSVFYHPDYGLGVSNKGTRFGMVLAFISIIALMISGWWTRRKASEEHEEDIEEFMTHSEEPIPAYSPPLTHVTPSPSIHATPSPRSHYGSSVDPLTLDARTRYRMMQSQARSHASGYSANASGYSANASGYSANASGYSANARKNLWGSGGGSAFAKLDRTSENSNDSQV